MPNETKNKSYGRTRRTNTTDEIDQRVDGQIREGGEVTINLETRRRFLAASTLGLAAVILDSTAVHADEPTVETFALDPVGGDGKCSPNCASCSACVAHAANKLFATKDAADSGRAHKGCNCAITTGQALTEGSYKQLFAAQASADRRYSDVSAVLGGNVQQHSVPMFVGTGPALAIGSGAAATLWIVRRRLQLMSPR